VLEWKYIIRGNAGAGAAARYSGEAVYYRTSGDRPFGAAAVKRVQSDRNSVTIQAIIPPVFQDHGDRLEYFETILFDGRPVQTWALDQHHQATEVNDRNPRKLLFVKAS
jgi:hypothetical protein